MYEINGLNIYVVKDDGSKVLVANIINMDAAIDLVASCNVLNKIIK